MKGHTQCGDCGMFTVNAGGWCINARCSGIGGATAEGRVLAEQSYFEEVRDSRPLYDEDGYPVCRNPGGHKYECTGTAYGGDDPRWFGEGRMLCIYCGADGDA